MTWRCASCGTTLTYTGQPVPAMQECPRCGKWMEQAAPEEPSQGETS